MRNRLSLFPGPTSISNNTLQIAGHELGALAEKFGTPLYVYDQQTADTAVSRYQAALKAHYPGSSQLTYAGKAFLCGAVTRWTRQRGLWLDCTGEAEIAMAVAGGVPPPNIVVHGVSKSRADLEAAVRQAGTIVVDNIPEIQQLTSMRRIPERARDLPWPVENVWLRLQPGLPIATHHSHTQTGQSDSKFGMTPGELLDAAKEARGAGLPLDGIHFHLGSNFRDTAPLVHAIDLALELVPEMGLAQPWHFCPGGGWGVAYREEELPNPDVAEYVHAISETVSRRCRARRLALPVLHLEPGRSLVARAGVAIYRVGAVKRRGDRTWLLVDGGIADNPRHALYGAEYSCLPAAGLGRELSQRVSIGGPHCEAGDVLTEDVMMPAIEPGEFIVVPMSGAYQLSMASNYNGACRPAVLWLEGGAMRLVIRRETAADLRQRDLPMN